MRPVSLKKILVFISLFFFVIFPYKIEAKEVIKNYDVFASIDVHGKATIIEKITVRAENDKINRGIYRDFPLIYKNNFGYQTKVHLKLLGVRRNGLDEAYHTENLPNILRVYIGNPNIIIQPGIYTYELIYHVKPAVSFFESYDEFYWNVTGNSWEFPIENARIVISLPEEATVQAVEGYLGVAGARDKAYQVQKTTTNIILQTLRPLDYFEGFTVAVSFQKGVVQPPNFYERIYNFILDNLVGLISALTIMLFSAFVFLSWLLYGRDTPGTIIAQFQPPENLSADMLRYIVKQRYDDKALVSLILSAAADGYLQINDDGKKFVIKKTSHFPKNPISGTYQVLYRAFNRDVILLDKTRFRLFKTNNTYKEELAKFLLELKAEHKRYLGTIGTDYFSQNMWIKAIAIFIACAGLGLIGVLTDKNHFEAACSLLIPVCGLFLSAFWRPLNKYTQEGQEAEDFARGFKKFINVVEKNPLNIKYTKEMTPQVFEKILPYAVALDVEQKWCKYFSALVSTNMVVYKSSYYQSFSTQGQFSSSIASSLGHNISAAINSTIQSTSSGSSGSGGGGSSGGGGGGGGGGGW